MTNKQLKSEVKKGDRIIEFQGEKRIFYRLYRNGIYFCTITKNQYQKLKENSKFEKFNLFGTKRVFVIFG